MQYLSLLFLKSVYLHLKFFSDLEQLALFLRHGFVFCLQQERKLYHTNKTLIPPQRRWAERGVLKQAIDNSGNFKEEWYKMSSTLSILWALAFEVREGTEVGIC